jgi:hypothetical protein
MNAAVDIASQRWSNCTAASLYTKLRHAGDSASPSDGNTPAAHERELVVVDQAGVEAGDERARHRRREDERRRPRARAHAQAAHQPAAAPAPVSGARASASPATAAACRSTNAEPRCVASRRCDTRATAPSLTLCRPLLTIHQPAAPCRPPSAKDAAELERLAARDAPARQKYANGTRELHLLHDVHALGDLAEHDVLAVEPRRHDRRDEELRAVGAGAGVGHREQAGFGVLELEVLVGELLAVDRLAARAVAAREVTTLAHELLDDAVEGASPCSAAVCLTCQRPSRRCTGRGSSRPSWGRACCRGAVRQSDATKLFESKRLRLGCAASRAELLRVQRFADLLHRQCFARLRVDSHHLVVLPWLQVRLSRRKATHADLFLLFFPSSTTTTTTATTATTTATRTTATTTTLTPTTTTPTPTPTTIASGSTSLATTSVSLGTSPLPTSTSTSTTMPMPTTSSTVPTTTLSLPISTSSTSATTETSTFTSATASTRSSESVLFSSAVTSSSSEAAPADSTVLTAGVAAGVGGGLLVILLVAFVGCRQHRRKAQKTHGAERRHQQHTHNTTLLQAFATLNLSVSCRIIASLTLSRHQTAVTHCQLPGRAQVRLSMRITRF